MGKMKDITGQTFGKLTVIECAGKLDGRRYFWKCQCECGNIVTKEGSLLRSGNTKSCGCGKYDGFKKYNEMVSKGEISVNKNISKKEITSSLIPLGTQFGKLTVIEDLGLKERKNDSKRRYYRCQCECGNIKETYGNYLKNGQVSSCGLCKLKSLGEFKIKTLLDENNIFYDYDLSILDLIEETGRRLRFDFVLYKDKEKTLIDRIVEFDGRQHFYGPDTNYWGRSKDTLKSIQERDEIKNNFCINHNYPLIRIPYTHLKNLKLDDIIGDKYLYRRQE